MPTYFFHKLITAPFLSIRAVSLDCRHVTLAPAAVNVGGRMQKSRTDAIFDTTYVLPSKQN